MANYFDSSLLLTILLDEAKQKEAYNIWLSDEDRLSSVLLRIETDISIKRYYKQNKHILSSNWLASKEIQLNKFLNEIHYKPIDENFAYYMAKNDIFAGCRSLDAIHIATAVHFKYNGRGEKIHFCSFDRNMLKVAKELGFETNSRA
jgi:predicted nucleic acid-binding protein